MPLEQAFEVCIRETAAHRLDVRFEHADDLTVAGAASGGEAYVAHPTVLWCRHELDEPGRAHAIEGLRHRWAGDVEVPGKIARGLVSIGREREVVQDVELRLA